MVLRYLNFYIEKRRNQPDISSLYQVRPNVGAGLPARQGFTNIFPSTGNTSSESMAYNAENAAGIFH